MKIKTNTTENLRISGLKQLATPRELKSSIPLSDDLANQIIRYRDEIRNIIHMKDNRLC